MKPNTENWELLYHYWFANIEPTQGYIDNRLPIWFFASPEEDQKIRRDFVPWLSDITPEIETAWKQTPRSFLTLVLLFDQIPRNAFRGTPKSFSFDNKGLSLARSFIDSDFIGALQPIETLFAWLPLQHQENKNDQETQLKGINQAGESAPEGHKKFFAVAKNRNFFIL